MIPVEFQTSKEEEKMKEKRNERGREEGETD